MLPLMHKEGYPYAFNPNACSSCEARCCTGESGYIFVSQAEILKICELLNLDISEFVAKYLFKKDYKYSIRERRIGDSYECLFYDRANNGCSIYEARPQQCRTFPFWDYFKNRVDEVKKECPGIVNV